MSNLDNITHKIQSEAKAEAEAILDRAQNDSNSYLEGVKAELEAEIARQVKYAEEKAEASKDRVMAGARLQARDQVLSAQQDLINQIFDQAKAKLIAMSDRELLNLVKARLESYEPETGDVLILPLGRKLALPPEIPVEYDPQLKSGFALRRGGVSEKHDYLEILEFQRDDLEQALLDLVQKA